MALTPTPVFSRVLLLVADGLGCGALPDAAAYGDEGSDTLGHVSAFRPLRLPHLRELGLARLVDGLAESPGASAEGTGARGAWGRMAETSPGKDSVTGHWELMGLVLSSPFATFPQGFPSDLIREFERRIGRATLGNVVASGTAILDVLGEEHLRKGRPIVYTSADSVFQLAAHEDVVPVPQLYEWCQVAFDLVAPRHVARVIARPFVGAPGAFRRTANRHDYALPPIGETLLDRLSAAGVAVHAIGKVNDLFAGRGISTAMATRDDRDGMRRVLACAQAAAAPALVFANLVDFDAVYGHRNDVAGFAANLEAFDEELGPLRAALRPGDLLVITADHGNDPTTPSTDHSREYVPLLLSGARVRAGVELGTRASFADLGQTLAANFGVGPLAHGRSFLEEIRVQHP